MIGNKKKSIKINMLDLFSGVGGFHLGLKQAGFTFDWVGFSEVDKYATAVYKHKFKNSEELGDVKSIQSKDLPTIDIITFGSPCQDFSIAGKRAGATQGTRSSLIWEAIRLIDECKPRFFIWENVKGTFSSNDGADFWAIIQAFANIGGYRLEWELLNSSWFLPQNRQRIYLVGYFGGRGGQSVFPIGEPSKISNNRNTEVANTLQHPGHSGGNYRGMTMIAEATKKGYAEAEVGDAINLERPTSKTRRERVTKGYAQSLETIQHQHTIQPKKIEIIGNLKGKDGHECHNVHSTEGIAPTVRHNHGKTTMVQPVLTPNRAEKRQNGRRFKEDGEDMFKLTQQDQHGVKLNNSIRRLTPIECERLQGFPDDWTSKGIIDGKVVDMSDTQRYKQCGNAVTVDVVQAVAERIYPLINFK